MKTSVKKEIGFVPSALSELPDAIHWCDNQCSEHRSMFNQIAAMVTEEGSEAHTFNLCKLCHIERLARRGKQSVKAAEWREVVKRKAHRRRLWKVFRWHK